MLKKATFSQFQDDNEVIFEDPNLKSNENSKHYDNHKMTNDDRDLAPRSFYDAEDNEDDEFQSPNLKGYMLTGKRGLESEHGASKDR